MDAQLFETEASDPRLETSPLIAAAQHSSRCRKSSRSERKSRVSNVSMHACNDSNEVLTQAASPTALGYPATGNTPIPKEVLSNDTTLATEEITASDLHKPTELNPCKNTSFDETKCGELSPETAASVGSASGNRKSLRSGRKGRSPSQMEDTERRTVLIKKRRSPARRSKRAPQNFSASKRSPPTPIPAATRALRLSAASDPHCAQEPLRSMMTRLFSLNSPR
jgi:hypothetical protein